MERYSDECAESGGWRKEAEGYVMLYCRHLRRYSPLALQLHLVLLERLLTTALEVRAAVVLRESVLKKIRQLGRIQGGE
jgi:hypothetical protein